jgi:hypothetical protein
MNTFAQRLETKTALNPVSFKVITEFPVVLRSGFPVDRGVKLPCVKLRESCPKQLGSYTLEVSAGERIHRQRPEDELANIKIKILSRISRF